MVLTPTAHDVPHIIGDFSSLAQAFDYAASGHTGVNFYSATGELKESLSYGQLRDRACAAARRLRHLEGVRGARVALIAETGSDFLSAFYGCQYAGLIPCPLPFSVHMGGLEAYIAQLASMLKAARASILLAPQSVLSCAQAAAASLEGLQVLSYEALALLPECAQALIPLGAQELAYIQFSSGSTSEPKGVLISQRAICANARTILQSSMYLTEQDRAFSWLPFYHDMGLVGFSIAPLFGQCSIDYLSPTAFARRPVLWLSLMSANGTSITYSPSFGYQLAAQRLSKEPHSALDLSRLRIAGVGGDMVRAAALREAAKQLAPYGFRAEAFLPSYGMAEATLAISTAQTGQGLRTDVMGAGNEFVSCGQPLPGSQVRIEDEAEQAVPEGTVGQIWFKGASLMDGYLDQPEGTQGGKRADGFLNTGDLGYQRQGQLYITGRAKDMILLRGRNLWPQDIEQALEAHALVKSGDVAAISVTQDDEETLVVLVQCRAQATEVREQMIRELSALLNQHFGVTGQIVLIPARALPYTSSGKLARARAKEKYLQNEFSNDVEDF